MKQINPGTTTGYNCSHLRSAVLVPSRMHSAWYEAIYCTLWDISLQTLQSRLFFVLELPSNISSYLSVARVRFVKREQFTCFPPISLITFTFHSYVGHTWCHCTDRLALLCTVSMHEHSWSRFNLRAGHVCDCREVALHMVATASKLLNNNCLSCTMSGLNNSYTSLIVEALSKTRNLTERALHRGQFTTAPA